MTYAIDYLFKIYSNITETGGGNVCEGKMILKLKLFNLIIINFLLHHNSWSLTIHIF